MNKKILIGSIFAVLLMLSLQLGSNIQAEANSTKLETQNETIVASGLHARIDIFFHISDARDLEPYGIGKCIGFKYSTYLRIKQYDDGTVDQAIFFNGKYGQYLKDSIRVPVREYIQASLNNGRTSFPFLVGKLEY